MIPARHARLSRCYLCREKDVLKKEKKGEKNSLPLKRNIKTLVILE